ncbi:cell wall-binding repeat-containing protein [Agromyces tardus]|nr:cell wall-binding repeat-containing protein [Agromyces tardus]
MAPHTMAGLRRAAVLAATLALLGTGMAPAYAADPTPDLIPPASTTEPDPSASDVPVGLLAKAPAGSPASYLAANGADGAATASRSFAVGESDLAAGTGSISGTITALAYTGVSSPLTSAWVAALVWDDAAGDYVVAASAYGDPVTGAYTIPDLAAGDYVVVVFDEAPGSPLIAEFYEDAQYIEQATVISLADGEVVTGIDEQLEPLLKGRIAGADRYATAVAVSQSFAAGVPCVFVANGLNFPDALSAGPAAAHCGGPLLLVPGTSIPQVVKDEIARLAPERIVVAGGTGAVSAGVEATLRTLAPQFARYAGADRYDTSRKIVAGEFGTTGALWVASGANFPDALSASAAASAADIPVLIVPGSSSALDSASANLLTSLGADLVAIAGGTGAVSTGIESSIAKLPLVADVLRVGGATRYDTAFKIMDLAWGYDGATAVYAFFASGENFPDALAGAPFAGLIGAPLYVTPASCTSLSVQQQISDLVVAEAYVLGYYQSQLYYEGGKPFRTC